MAKRRRLDPSTAPARPCVTGGATLGVDPAEARSRRSIAPAPKHNIKITGMAEELASKDAAAAEYDSAFARVTAHFMPFLVEGCSHCTGYAHP